MLATAPRVGYLLVAGLVAAGLAACGENVVRPGTLTGPAGAPAAPPISILTPEPGASVDRNVLAGSGIRILVDVSRLPQGASVRFTAHEAGRTGAPLFQETRATETGRLTTEAHMVLDAFVLGRMHTVRLTATGLAPDGSVAGEAVVELLLH
jgi:hypothetical protein